MGIVGLTTYIENRADYYLEYFELHNTLLIIDGLSVYCTMYGTISRCNQLFGGDYDILAQYICQFFTDLLLCNVTPLVILDGGWEGIKYLTKIQRMKERIKKASDCVRKNQVLTAFPLLGYDVFIDIMKKLKIKYVMSPFEADDNISSIAKLLNVPVLSYDSDFFIYGVDYIPFNTLQSNISKDAKGYVKKCCIYRTSKLLRKFKGLNSNVLPLASILLGNDYISRREFDDFFKHLSIKKTKNQNEQQRRIEITLNWLKEHSLNTAIDAIMRRLSHKQQKIILPSIEFLINKYSSISTFMLRPLGIDGKSVLDIHNNFEAFEYQADIEKIYTADKIWSTDEFINLVPQWFADDYLAGKLPAYFLNILTHRIYIMPAQIEDVDSSSAHEISIPIVKLICSLLTTSKTTIVNNTDTTVQLFIREKSRLKSQKLSVSPASIPFEDIKKLSSIHRKKIIDDILKIHVGDKLNELPLSWQLYVATILFWMRHSGDTKRTLVHLDSLLMCMLIGIIDRVIGIHKSGKMNQKNINREIDEVPEKIMFEKNIDNGESKVIVNLINSVTKNDCNAALPFFTNHITINEKLYMMRKKFCINIVHTLAQFQSCLIHAMNLNALLDYIYVQPSPQKFLNGTLFYNLCSNFCTRVNVNTYIATKLKDSPTLLNIYMKMHEKIFDALQDMKIEQGTCNTRRKRRKNRQNKKLVRDNGSAPSESDDDSEDNAESNDNFYDVSNRFTFLHS